MAIKGYARCSLNETKQDLNRQIRDIQNFCGKDTHVDFYQEFEHGDATVKKELNKLFDSALPGDTIVVTEVSRLSRSTKQLCEIIDLIKEKHLCLQIIGSITIDCRSGSLDPMTEAFLTMAGVFAQLELNMIRERVKSGIQNARAKGKHIGRPRLTHDTLPDDFYRHYDLLQNKSINKSEFARMIGVSRPTLRKYLRVAGYTDNE